MASDWIIIGAIIVLVAGVVLVFRTAAQDAPDLPRADRPKSRAKAAAHSG
ncbi:MAG: hypothetical protein V3U96_09015 [Paracoccaceae bacterium]